MAEPDRAEPYPVVILGNGKFPSHPVPLEKLRMAKTIICLNGSAQKALRHGCEPSVVIGDMDSLDVDLSGLNVEFIQRGGQHNTDLEKAVRWSVQNGFNTVTLLGVTGEREDHTLASFLIVKDHVSELQLTLMTDHFTVHYLEGKREFPAKPGQKVSLLCLGVSAVISTRGLKFGLDNEQLKTGGHGISNEATGKAFLINVKKGGLFVFIAHPL